MAESKWTNVNGVSNLGESDEHIVARVNNDNNTEVAYMAYCGLRIVELEGNLKFGDIMDNQKKLDKFTEAFSDFEVAIPVETESGTFIVGIDSMDSVLCEDNTVTRCISSVNIDAEEIEEYDDETGVLEMFDLA